MATLQILLQLGVSATTTNKLELETQSRTLDLNLKHSTPVSLSYRPGDVKTLHRHDTSVFGIGLNWGGGLNHPMIPELLLLTTLSRDRSNAEDNFLYSLVM